MRRIPTAKQKEELKCLLKKQYEDVVDSIDRDVGLHPALEDWRLADEIEKKIRADAGHLSSEMIGGDSEPAVDDD